MTHEEAAAILHVTLPVSPNALKMAFRRRASAEHPDHSQHPQATTRFLDVQEAFELLAKSDHVVGTSPEARCTDGTPLTECGLGLGPTVNGKLCPDCRGNGYLSVLVRTEACPDCRPIFTLTLFAGLLGYEWKCPRCGGTGRFRRNDKDVGECRRCRGKGWIRTRTNRCETCHGTEKNPNVGSKYYVRCRPCDGTGEVKVWNPVLPKGLFTGKGES